MEQLVLNAEPRSELGSRAAERLRRAGRLPANIYGQAESQLLVTVDAKEMKKFLDAGHRIATIRVGSREERGYVKEVQYDHLGTTMVHIDFGRISRFEKMQMAVPVETIGVPRGIAAGGVLVFPLKEVAISGLPDDIPEHYQLNIEALEIGQAIRIKDLTPPPKCTFVGDPELVVLTIAQKREEVPVAPVEAQPVQPEVIGKKKKEEEEEEPAAEESKKKEKDKDKEKEK